MLHYCITVHHNNEQKKNNVNTNSKTISTSTTKQTNYQSRQWPERNKYQQTQWSEVITTALVLIDVSGCPMIVKTACGTSSPYDS